MWIFKRGAAQAAPVVKNVSVTELLVRRETVQGVDSAIPKTAPDQRKGLTEKPAAAGKGASEDLRGSTF